VKASGERNGDVSGLADRLPPQNIEAEQGVLGSILLDNEVLHDIIPILKVDDFYRDAHQVIYRAIRDLYRDGYAIDAITLVEELQRRDQFKAIGGDEALGRILGSVPHPANAGYYAQIVRQKSKSRLLIEAANQTLSDAYRQDLTADELVEAAERRIFKIADEDATDATAPARAAVNAALDRISKRKTGPAGIGSGLPDLDDVTDGFQPEQLIIIAARPSMGKTAIALNMLEWISLTLGEPALLVSLEMNRVELGERMLCLRSNTPNWKLKRTDAIEPEEMRALIDAHDEWERSPLQIDDSPTRSTLQILANARRQKARIGLKILVVDYLQIITPGEGDSRQEKIAEISRDLKTIARELKIPVICMCQLNREVEKRADRRPVMADLRESGGIENDADLVLLLHRPEYYDASDKPGLAELIVAKNRNGETTKIDLKFLKELGRFECLPDRQQRIRDAGIPAANPGPNADDFIIPMPPAAPIDRPF
jgi:replicative DNA helicase